MQCQKQMEVGKGASPVNPDAVRSSGGCLTVQSRQRGCESIRRTSGHKIRLSTHQIQPFFFRPNNPTKSSLPYTKMRNCRTTKSNRKGPVRRSDWSPKCACTRGRGARVFYYFFLFSFTVALHSLHREAGGPVVGRPRRALSMRRPNSCISTS